MAEATATQRGGDVKLYAALTSESEKSGLKCKNLKLNNTNLPKISYHYYF